MSCHRACPDDQGKEGYSDYLVEHREKGFTMQSLIELIVASQPPRVGSIANSLRGGNILILDLPRRNNVLERIEVSEKKSALRAFYPIQHPRAYSKVDLNDELWEEIQALRRNWCAKLPVFRKAANQAPTYEVAIQCGRAINPVIRISPDQLPQLFQTLISVIPPPPRVQDGKIIEE